MKDPTENQNQELPPDKPGDKPGDKPEGSKPKSRAKPPRSRENKGAKNRAEVSDKATAPHPLPCPLPGLRPLRQTLGLSRIDLARQVGVSREHIRSLEEKNKNASGELQINLSKKLHCDLIDLYVNWYDMPEEKWKAKKDGVMKNYAIAIAVELISGALE